jgi:hypothetical protein
VRSIYAKHLAAGILVRLEVSPAEGVATQTCSSCCSYRSLLDPWTTDRTGMPKLFPAESCSALDCVNAWVMPSCPAFGWRLANSFAANLRGQGPRAEAERRAGCDVRDREQRRAKGTQAACRRPNTNCRRGFSPRTYAGPRQVQRRVGRRFRVPIKFS